MKRIRWYLALPFDVVVFVLFGLLMFAGFLAKVVSGDDL